MEEEKMDSKKVTQDRRKLGKEDELKKNWGEGEGVGDEKKIKFCLHFPSYSNSSSTFKKKKNESL